MPADAPTPLATTADLQDSDYWDLVANMSATRQANLMLRATRMVERECGRRLAPFTLTETHRLVDTDVEDAVSAALPLPSQAQMNVDYARALGYPLLVRHFWLAEYPPAYPDMWTGGLTDVTIKWSYGETLTVDMSTVQFEPDTGHGRFLLGTFVPPGSTGVFTYTGGYTTIPADLVEACCVAAAILAVHSLEPQARPEVDTEGLRGLLDGLLADYDTA